LEISVEITRNAAISPRGSVLEDLRLASGLQQINYCHDDRSNNNPEKLKPIKKWDANELRLREIVERRPEHGDEGKK
jgi:hypothetical protein